MGMAARVDVFAVFALEYAKWGWPVFPVNGKRAFLPGGFYRASCDPAVVRALWHEHPRHNIGFRTGDVAWVLDVDPRHGGDVALAVLEHRYGSLPETVRVRTGGGGGHLYFAPDPRITNARGVLPAGLDVRGVGGYTVLPPSVHPDSGDAYRFLIGASPQEVPLAVAPPWLCELILQPTPHAAEPEGPIGPGRRHEFLLRQGSVLAWMGLTDTAIRAELEELNRTRCQPPLPGPGPEGWHRLLSTLARYAERGRAQRRAERLARGTIASEESIDDQAEPGTTSPDEVWPEPVSLEAATV